jgi:hypothetical protein
MKPKSAELRNKFTIKGLPICDKIDTIFQQPKIHGGYFTMNKTDLIRRRLEEANSRRKTQNRQLSRL